MRLPRTPPLLGLELIVQLLTVIALSLSIFKEVKDMKAQKEEATPDEGP